MKALYLFGTAMLLGAASTAYAQAEVGGRLGPSSPRDGSPYEVRTIQLSAGQRYEIGVVSNDFDPAVDLLRPGAPDTASSDDDDSGMVLQSDDDSGEGNNALIEFTPDTTGIYKLRIKTVDRKLGRFEVVTRRLPPLPAPARATGAVTTMQGTTYQGAFDANGPTVRMRGVRDYLVTLTGGKQAVISLVAAGDDKFDPVLEVYTGSRIGKEAAYTDDDGGEGTNSLLVFTPEMTGTYVVRATTNSEKEYGRFTLTVMQ